ncbi:glycosyltransferase family 4 protein [Sphingobacterium lumbrici]|uniref:glycosyltransferase family 4 protein n=1 Tax=Sphingobacterium lumbrici TaxID=2559600 RepID=UPI001127B66A|nr:glycosyltransferase family 4 protein [Sphingobacterium lumbrici]
MNKVKLIRITTVPTSLKILLKGQHRFMSENGFDVIGISSSGEELQDVEREENIRTIAVEMTRTISPFKDLKSVWQLYKIFKKEKPQIVHTHTPKAGTVGMLAAKLAGVPHRLHTVAGLPLLVAKGKKRKLLDFVEKITYRCATKIYPNSVGLYDIILENKYTSKGKLKVIGEGSSNGIDTSHFNPALISEQQKQELKNSLGIKPEDFLFVFVGRIVADKGINELVAAFKNSKLQVPNSKLLLVGDFETALDPLLPETLKEMDTNPNIISVGYQSDVRPYFAISDCLVFPSYREGFPNVVMQAGAMGLPSIVTDINGCNEIVKDGFNGLIIPAQNQEKLYEKMLFLLENPEKRKEIADNSRQQIVENYERKYIWNELLKEYHTLLNK